MKRKNIPNIITVFRFFLIIPILATLLSEEYRFAFFAFALAGLSDGLDGFLARHFNWLTRFGAIADPIADKLLMLGTYLSLAYLQKIPLWLMSVVIGRDLIIIAAALIYHYWIEKPIYGASLMSKVNTVLQLLLVVVILFDSAFRDIPDAIIETLIYIVLFSTIISFLDYCWLWGRRAWKIKRASYD